MISSDVLRGYNDTIVLSCLLENDSYGYEINRMIANKSSGTYLMKETTLYSIFTRLEKNGYISSYEGEESLGKQRRYYRITNQGVVYYLEKCIEWEETQKLMTNFIRRKENGKNK